MFYVAEIPLCNTVSLYANTAAAFDTFLILSRQVTEVTSIFIKENYRIIC
jgi:hypothetical protein